MLPIVVAITGASGSLYAVRLLDVLLAAGSEIQLTLSPAASEVIQQELEFKVDLSQPDLDGLLNIAHQFFPDDRKEHTGTLSYVHFQDYFAGIASGSYLTAGMVICPCSMGTLAGVAHGFSSNLIQRAADVHLKERRKLILVPRETPLGSIQLGNMKTLADAGAVILPAMPGFYQRPRHIGDLIDFVVGRICDQLGVPVSSIPRWGGEGS